MRGLTLFVVSTAMNLLGGFCMQAASAWTGMRDDKSQKIGTADGTGRLDHTRNSVETRIQDLRADLASMRHSVSALHDAMAVGRHWQFGHDRLLQNLVFDGQSIVATRDILVKNANLFVWTELLDESAIGKGNLVVGMNHTYTEAFNSFVAGSFNTIAGESTSVLGGSNNHAVGAFASVAGGRLNFARGNWTVVSGGEGNQAFTKFSSVSGGRLNGASGEFSSISGGLENWATGFEASSVSGGVGNIASGVSSSISGGFLNRAQGARSSISGGEENVAANGYVSVLGGEGKTVAEHHATWPER